VIGFRKPMVMSGRRCKALRARMASPGSVLQTAALKPQSRGFQRLGRQGGLRGGHWGRHREAA
jgi:hypothetical protein